MWVASSCRRVRVIFFELCDSRVDVEGSDLRLHFPSFVKERCLQSQSFFSVRGLHRRMADGGSQTHQGEQSSGNDDPWRMEEQRLVELVQTYVRRKMMVSGYLVVETSEEHCAVMHEEEYDSKGITERLVGNPCFHFNGKCIPVLGDEEARGHLEGKLSWVSTYPSSRTCRMKR